MESMTRMRSCIRLLAAALFAGIAAGCAQNVIISDHADKCYGAPGGLSVADKAAFEASSKISCNRGVPSGLVYSLPKGRVLLTAYRKLITSADVAKAQLKLTTDQATAAADAKKVSDLSAAKDKDIKAGAAQATLDADDLAIKAAQAIAAVDEAQIKLDTGAVQDAQDGQTNKKYTETFAVTPLPIVPDAKRRFVANLSHGITRDDTFKLSVVNGMLSSTATQSSDQSVSIFNSLADAAVSAAQLAGAGVPLVPPGVAPAARPEPGKPPTQCEFVYATVFDPANAKETDDVQTALTGLAARIQLSVLPKDVVPGVRDRHTLDWGKDNVLSIDGLVYRVPLGLYVVVSPEADANTSGYCQVQTLPQPQTADVVVPDSNADFIVPVVAGSFTSSNYNYNFSNGMLTDYNFTHPSELAAVASVPVNVINKILTIPGSILKLRLDYTTAQTNLATQQANLINAQASQAAALVNAQTSLETAQTNLATADLNDPTARIKALTALIQARKALADAIKAANAGSAAALGTAPAN